MAHTFLALDTTLIPQSTKNNIPTYNQGLFSNDGSRLLIDGYNDARSLVHPLATLTAWLQWELNPQLIIDQLISTAIEYTHIEILAEKADVNSIWYQPEVIT